MPAASEQSQNSEPYIDRLPPFFPTSCKQCEKQTEQFFQCFEKYAVMKDATDTVSAKQSLQHCQGPLREYKVCMEKHMNATKPWWKVW